MISFENTRRKLQKKIFLIKKKLKNFQKSNNL